MCGGIGIHIRLKSECHLDCEFESRRMHHKQERGIQMDFKKILRFVLLVTAIALTLILIRSITISLYKVSMILEIVIMAIAIVVVYEFVRSKIKKNK